ncbi:MAG TPA: YicC/YloC family endoribonuclease, partial [Burkholderiales bacterium]|nr:YicC/YloC family endoribonuclease [Burkholderiales bacterium]
MTGYATAARELEGAVLNLELRSVNHRYLDIQFRIPDELRAIEPALREALTARLNRGKVECRIAYAVLPGRKGLDLNADLLQQILALNNQVRAMLPEAASVSASDVLRWPGMLAGDTL